jgi:hypothetical protein
MSGEAKLLLGIVTAVHICGDCVEKIKIDHFIRLKEWGKGF